MNDAFLKLLIIKTGVRDRQCISKMHSCTCTLYIYKTFTFKIQSQCGSGHFDNPDAET